MMRRFRTYPQIGGTRGGIPSGWVEVDYVESTGTQWIDTGFSMSKDGSYEPNFFFEAKFSVFARNDKLFRVYGRINAMSWYVQLGDYAAAKADVYFGTPLNDLYSGPSPINNPQTIRATATSVSIDGLVYNREEPTGLKIPTRKIYLFAENYTTELPRSIYSARLYYFRASGANGEIYMVGIRNATTNEVAMCDILTGDIYRNAGTGAFIAGPDKGRKTARDYVQDGLIAMWDGIENAGWGVHDPDATVWKDLSNNGRDAVLSGSINFGDSYINMTGGCALFTSIPKNECITTEIIFKKTNDRYVQFVQLSNGSGPTDRSHVGVRANNCVIFHNKSCGNFLVDVKVVNQVSFSHETGICYVNGREGTVIDVGGSFSGQRTGFGAYTMPYNEGIVYACRVYNRSLSAEEVLKNYEIDKARFGLT